MPGNVTTTEAQGQPTIPASADYAVCVVGYTTDSPVDAGLVSPPYSSPTSCAGDFGLGDAVDCALQAIVSTQGNPAPPPVCIYKTPATTPGVRGGTFSALIGQGSALITQTATTPVGTYEPVVRVTDDGNDGDGGLIGTAGIVLQASPDNGRTWLQSEALGTAVTYKMRIPVDGVLTDTGVQWDIGPSTTNAAYVALAVELRADTLAHLANVTAHDAADTGTEQVVLAASSAPTTVTQANAVIILVRAALVAHFRKITVHDGPDIVNTITLGAPVTTAQCIDVAIQCKAKLNLHEAASAVALAAAAAGLKAGTASGASPVTYTAAAHFISGGVTAMDLNPRRPTIAVSGVTASDAPATADWTGVDLDGNAQTETVTVPQTATSVTATKAYKGTGLQVAFAAGDGTGAVLTLGYSNGVHNSVDSTNTIAAADPTYGLLFTGDTWSESISTPPMWATTDLYTAGTPATGAFGAIARSGTSFAIIALTEPVATADFATLTTGLNYLASSAGGSKRVALLIRFRDPIADETDAAYVLAFRTFAAANQDDRITCVVGNGWLTDAFRGFRYHRTGMPAVLARMQSFPVVPGSIGEKIAQHPGFVGRGPLEGFSITDDGDNVISQAHDESSVTGIDGPVNGVGGGLTFYQQRVAGIAGTYVSQAPTMYPGTSGILTWMDRRIINGIESIATLIAWLEIQGADIFDPVTFALDADIRDAIQTKIGKAIKDRYAGEFQNWADPNLVVVNETVSVDGSQVTIGGGVNPRLFGYTNTINLTFSASR